MSFEIWKGNAFNPTGLTYYEINNLIRECWNAAQAEMWELGPCGKHPKIFLRMEEGVELEGNKQVYFRDKVCSICEEIRLEVEKALRVADDKEYVNRNMTGICICGAPSGKHFESDHSCPETGCHTYSDSSAVGDTKPGE